MTLMITSQWRMGNIGQVIGERRKMVGRKSGVSGEGNAPFEHIGIAGFFSTGK